jgi:hypothetical protein
MARLNECDVLRLLLSVRCSHTMGQKGLRLSVRAETGAVQVPMLLPYPLFLYFRSPFLLVFCLVSMKFCQLYGRDRKLFRCVVLPDTPNHLNSEYGLPNRAKVPSRPASYGDSCSPFRVLVHNRHQSGRAGLKVPVLSGSHCW